MCLYSARIPQVKQIFLHEAAVYALVATAETARKCFPDRLSVMQQYSDAVNSTA